jgi:hypothetical protein
LKDNSEHATLKKKVMAIWAKAQPPMYLFIVVRAYTPFCGYLGQNQSITNLFSDPPFLLTPSPSSSIPCFFSHIFFLSFFTTLLSKQIASQFFWTSLILFSLILIQEIIWAST